MSAIVPQINHMIDEHELNEREVGVLLLIYMSKLSKPEKKRLFPEVVKELGEKTLDPGNNWWIVNNWLIL